MLSSSTLKPVSILPMALLCLTLQGCDHGGRPDGSAIFTNSNLYTVSTSAGTGGNFNPPAMSVREGNTAQFTVNTANGYAIDSVSGCGGSLNGNTYTTGTITADCTVTASFNDLQPDMYTVTAVAGTGGSLTPPTTSVREGDAAVLTVGVDSGYAIDSVTGCDGSLSGNTYTTGAITADCTVTASFILLPPDTAAAPSLSYTPIKGFTFDWTDVSDATYYRLQEDPDGASGFTQVGADIATGEGTVTIRVPLYKRVNAQYVLQSCNDGGCTDSAAVNVDDEMLVDSVGYVKASNTDGGDLFGASTSLSGDGSTLAVGAYGEASDGSSEADDSLPFAGAVYLFIRDTDDSWSQQAYVKAGTPQAFTGFGISVSLSEDGSLLAAGVPGEDGEGKVYVYSRDSGGNWTQQTAVQGDNTGSADDFGSSVSLDGDGATLAVGAAGEASNATDVDGDGTNNSISGAGAAYVFTRDSFDNWTQQAYVKASDPDGGDNFGVSVVLSTDGSTLAVGAVGEDSNATGIGGDDSDDSSTDAGAAYVYNRNGDDSWSPQAYVKPSDTNNGYAFGVSTSLSADGNTLAVGAPGADATYVFSRSGSTWTQQTIITSSGTDSGDGFGLSVDLSDDGTTLAVGATDEDSNALGISGTGSTNDNSLTNTGAVYVYRRASDDSWSEQAYVKASNTGDNDLFGQSVSLSGDGDTLAVGAQGEASNATGIGNDETDNSASNAGAVYLY